MGGGNQPVAGALLATEKGRVQGAAAGRCVDHTKGRRPQTTFRVVREAMFSVLSLIFLVHYLMSHSTLGIPPYGIIASCLISNILAGTPLSDRTTYSNGKSAQSAIY